MSKYKDKWYEKKSDEKEIAAREVVSELFDIINPASVIDVGCGDGSWLSVIMEMEGSSISEYVGVDGKWVSDRILKIPESNFKATDLKDEIKIERTFDLVISLEVAEHLPGHEAERFVEKLVSLGPIVLFSAAVPFQGGTNHKNEKWQHYWANLFSRHGYKAVKTIRKKIWNNKNIYDFYRQNMMLYVEKEKIKHLDISSSDIVANNNLISVIHPDLFERKMSKYSGIKEFDPRYISVRKLMKSIPRIFSYSIKSMFS